MYNTAAMPSNQNSTRRAAQPGVEWAWIVAASVLIVAVATLPYLLAYYVPPDHVFTGILVNPADGNSYLAKMREGWRGDWLFTLPYTDQPGPGAFIFTYYLFLGHLAHWSGASLDLVYGLARALGGLALLLSAYAFITRYIETRRLRLIAWLLFALGSGLGWLAVPFGAFTSDLWVAEAIPFLSVFVNAHFALATAMLLWILGWTAPGLAREPASAGRLGLIALTATALAQVQPLALLSIGLTLAGLLGWQLAHKRLTWAALRPSLVFGLFATPWVIYDAAVSYLNPVLAQWNAQNLTPSPAVWDLALSGGLPLLLGIAGAVVAARRRTDADVALLAWLGLGGLALYAPFALQRRLSLGLWMPLTLLAVIGLRELLWPRLAGIWRPVALAAVAVLSVPSNLLVYGATLAAVQRRDPAVFITQAEAAALVWLAAQAPAGSVVAASPEMGLLIPARTDARVVYGHPFETVEAAVRKQAIEDFYAGRMPAIDFVRQYGVAYVVWGDRERLLGGALPAAGWQPVFDDGTVVIYAP
jgi:hypothetical protein